MTKAEAKRYVCRCMGAQLQSDLDNGSLWLYESPYGGESGCEMEEMSAADQERVHEAVVELQDEMRRRGGR